MLRCLFNFLSGNRFFLKSLPLPFTDNCLQEHAFARTGLAGLCLLLIFSMIPAGTRAQSENLSATIARSEFQAKQVIPPSPEAAALGRYGNVPVSLFTGTPEINIPLYELKGNSLSLPISLSYNASGFKPEEMATWTGNWSLNAGGLITRSVLGNPDTKENYFNAVNPLTPPFGSDMFAMYDYMTYVQQGTLESQPDAYYYNFASHSGKFYLTPGQDIIKKRRNDLNIISGITMDNSNFTVTDGQGITFRFTESEMTRSIPFDQEGQLSYLIYNYPSAWYLTEMTSADGVEKMIFEYYSTTGGQELTAHALQNRYSSYRYSDNPCFLDAGGAVGSEYGSTPPFSSVKRKFLKKISLQRNNETVAFIDFVSSAGQREDSDFQEDRLLNEIRIYSRTNGTEKLMKHYTLGYGYFINNSNTFTKKRLRLDALQERPVRGGTPSNPPYYFTYNVSGPVPERFTANLDHWGFYNAENNTSLIPILTVNNHLGSPALVGANANREPRLGGSSLTMLTKIQYPTGGYTAFDYELNEAKFTQDSIVRPVGGIRISRITDYSAGTAATVTKTYQYQLPDGSSSGRSGAFPEYLKRSFYTTYTIPTFPPPVPCSNQAHHFSVFTVLAGSIFGLGAVQGSHIGYSRVTETETDQTTGMSLGKTVYTYNIGYINEFDSDAGNGDQTGKYQFDSNGTLIKESTSLYEYEETGQINGFKVTPLEQQTNKTVYCREANGKISAYGYWESLPAGCTASRLYVNQLSAGTYRVVSQYGKLKEQREKTYDRATGSYLLRTKKYTYGNASHIYPTRIEHSSTGNSRIITLKKYAGDFAGTGISPDLVVNGIRSLKLLNMAGAEIESLQYRENADGSNIRYTGGTLTTYRWAPYPDSVYRLEMNEPVSNITLSSVTNGRFVFDSRYRPLAAYQYSSGNLIRESRAGGPPVSYIWDYNGLYPVASAAGSENGLIAYTSFETGSTGGWITENTGIDTSIAFSGSRSCIIASGARISKLLAGGPCSEELVLRYGSRNGALTVTVNGNLEVGNNQGPATIAGWTFYEHRLPPGTYGIEITSPGAVIDELRLCPRQSQMQTYTYEPFTGISSDIYPDGQVTYYSYDGMGRLNSVKDAEGNILQSYRYNYGSGTQVQAGPATLFYSTARQQSFTRNTCPAGEPTSELYKVPAGKYVSALSQTDADSRALAEIAANGQAYANNTGKCYFYNTEVRRRFGSNCSNGTIKLVWYTVEARKYRSEISQGDADARAQQDLTENGQAYANAQGGCPCSGEGEKMINGECQTGIKTYTGTVDLGNGSYRCNYIYTFSDGSTSTGYSEMSYRPCLQNP